MKCSIKKDGIKTVFDVDGKTIIPSAYMTYCVEQKHIDTFKKHGVNFFMLPVYAGDEGINMECGLRPLYENFFKGYGEYDFSIVEKLMNMIAPNGEEGVYVIPRVCLEPPIWWQRLHPEECARNHRGEAQRECFVSKKWREDMTVALKALIDYFENSIWKNNIIGYHIAAGGTEEWPYQSRNSKSFCDYSKPNLQAYKKFLERKYKSVRELSEAWGRSVDSFEDVVFPKPYQRLYASEGFIRCDAREQDVLDYFDFHNEAVADTIIYFCRQVKEYTNNNKITGAFYGYVVCMPHNKKGLHAMGTLLESPYIDFLSTTNHNKGPGGAWNWSSAVHSAHLHGKLWMAEGDIRTCMTNNLAEKIPHAAPDNDYYSSAAWKGPENMFLTLSALKKGIARSLTVPCGIWWFDMFGGWFDAPEMMEVIDKMAPLYEMQKENLFESEIALIIDEKGYKYFGTEDVKHATTMSQLSYNLSQCGAPFDIYLQSDITKEDFPVDRYKLYIFSSAVNFSEDEKKALSRLQSDGRVMMWLYASGYYNPQLTGFELEMPRSDIAEVVEFEGGTFPRINNLPALKFAKADGYIIARFAESREAAVVWKDMDTWESVHCLHLAPSAELFRHIALLAGVHLYNRTNDCIYAGGEFIALHAIESGYRRICLPYAECKATNALTGEQLKVNDRFIDIKMEKFDTIIVHIECDDKIF